MNARIKFPKDRMNKQTLKAANEYVREQEADIVRRIFKMFVVVMNDEYGFGKVRTGRILHAIDEKALEQKQDEVFWTHIDRRCHQIGFNFTDEDWRKGFS